MLYDWSRADQHDAAEVRTPAGVFFDETLRDGVQAPQIGTPTIDERLQLIDHMVRSGIRCADLGFPGSGPAAAHAGLAAARHIAAQGYPLVPGYAGRTHPADVRAICDIAQRAGVAVDAYIFIGVSPIRQYVENWSVSAIAHDIRVAAGQCRREGVDFVLALEDSARCPPAVLGRVYQLAVDLGITRITLCDSVGAAVPAGTQALLGWSTRFFAHRQHPVAFEWHGHNDRGLGLINALTALEAGCARVHGTVLGIGERAGNTSIDQLIVNSRLEYAADYDLEALRAYCEFASRVLGVAIPPNYPAMGRDVFTTSAGVHASAILKARQKGDVSVMDSVYAGVPASLLGREQEVLIDGSSGASNVRYWLAVNDVNSSFDGRVDSALVEHVLQKARLAGRPLTDEEIRRVIVAGT
jgi:2-isopropylmalate synthase